MVLRTIEATRLRPGPPGRTRHYRGMPTALGGKRTAMPEPSILAMCVSEEGYFLVRHTESGDFAGDTWHQTREDARHQAEFEYGERIVGWTTLAEGTVDFADVVAQFPHMTFTDTD